MAAESVQLDGIQLNSLTGSYVLRSIDFPPPAKRYEWVQGSDADGSTLVRDPLFENRTIPISLRINQQSTMDAALALIAQIGGKLEEAEQQPDGLPLVWTPAGSTHSITFYVLSGEINGIPVTKTGADRGWFRFYPVVNLTLTCKPFGYGSEVAGPSATASTPLVTLAVPNVAGDVPAEARIVVTDAASQARRDVIWGLEWHDYNAGSPASLLLGNTDFVTAGFAGVATVTAGSYGTGNPINALLYGQPTAVLGTGNQPHVGTFRVRARIQAVNPVRLRLAWQDGDGPFSVNDWVSTPDNTAWCEVDLGLITIQPAKLGTQRWTGRIEAYTTDNAAHSLTVNLLELIPAGEGYGRARATYSYRTGVTVAHDEFAGMASGAALNGRTAPVGGAWTTAGAATDFVATPATGAPAAVGATVVYRNTASEVGGRYALLGASKTDTEVSAMVLVTDFSAGSNNDLLGVAARYVDTNNALRAFLNPSTGTLSINALVGGSGTAVNAPPVTIQSGTINGWYILRLVVYASGAAYAALFTLVGTVVSSVAVSAGTFAALASGGALASGTAGLFDQGLSASNPVLRGYAHASVATPAAEPIVINASRQGEFRFDGTQRQDSAGTYYGRMPTYRGSPVFVPPAGDKNRASRVVVAARRNDTDIVSDGGVTDSTTVQAYYTPRYLAVPH